MGNSCCQEALCGDSRLVPSQETVQLLSRVPLFRHLPQDQVEAVSGASVETWLIPGEIVVRQGEEGDAFFVLIDGAMDVIKNGKKVAELKSGDYFGEWALLRNEPRAATVEARVASLCLRLGRDRFEELNLQEQIWIARRAAVAGGQTSAEAKQPTPKTPAQREMMVLAVQENQYLAQIVDLDESQVKEMVDAMWQEKVAAETCIICQGDLDAHYFYIVEDGCFDISIADDSGTSKSMEDAAVHVAEVRRGGSFGELALLHYAPRAATVTARLNSIVWAIDRAQFQMILRKKEAGLTEQYSGLLGQVEVLRALTAAERHALAGVLLEMTYFAGDTIFRQGEEAEMFYILTSGEVAVVQNGKEITTLKATLGQPSFFGERALLMSEPRAATIRVLSETVHALTLGKANFDMLLGPLSDFSGKDPYEERAVGSTKCLQGPTVPAGKKFGQVRSADLRRLGLLGCGGFGTVDLVEEVITKKTYALKSVSKGYILKAGVQKNIISEKEIQMNCSSNFIINLYETFNSPQNIQFLMELAQGGELYTTYNRKNLYGRPAHARFYTLSVVFAFEHLHAKMVVFRDLKPENLLLTSDGFVKLTDMGLAKVVLGKTYTVCGTPEYFAPELIRSKGHSRALDWYTLGILCFELMVGRSPFRSASPMEIYRRAVRGIDSVRFPTCCRGPNEDFIKSLCHMEPSLRLPMKPGGLQNIRDHPWLSLEEWVGVRQQSLAPPFKPSVRGKGDLSNFSVRHEDLPPQMPYCDPGTNWDLGFETSV